MTAMAVHASQVSHVPHLSWPRVGAWSGSFSLHLIVLAALLTPPVALQIARQIDKPVIFRFIEPEKIQPEPELPMPVRKQVQTPVRHVVTPHVATPIPQEKSEVTYVAPVDDTPPAIEHPTAIPDSEPSAITYGHQTSVPYPKESLINHEHGTVILRVLVGVDGLPQAIEIQKSSGYSRLDRAARDAVKTWSFHPAMRGGVASSAWALVPVTFNLQTF